MSRKAANFVCCLQIPTGFGMVWIPSGLHRSASLRLGSAKSSIRRFRGGQVECFFIKGKDAKTGKRKVCWCSPSEVWKGTFQVPGLIVLPQYVRRFFSNLKPLLSILSFQSDSLARQMVDSWYHFVEIQGSLQNVSLSGERGNDDKVLSSLAVSP